MSDEDYTPIDCGLYSRFEVAILHRDRIKLSWRDDSGLTHLEVVTPQDIRIHDGAEYLVAATVEGRQIDIRLDRIDATHSGLEEQ